MKSVIVGTGYMGMFIAALLSRCNEVGDVDIVPEKLVKREINPIQDEYVEKYLSENKLGLGTTMDRESIYKKIEYFHIQFIWTQLSKQKTN